MLLDRLIHNRCGNAADQPVDIHGNRYRKHSGQGQQQKEQAHQRAKIATALQQCRQLRRQHKDNIILLQPMVDMLETDKGKLAVSQLQQTLGQLRAAEKKMDNRTYSPRGMTPEEYKNKQTTIH